MNSIRISNSNSGQLENEFCHILILNAAKMAPINGKSHVSVPGSMYDACTVTTRHGLNVATLMMDEVQVFGCQSPAVRDKGRETKGIKASVVLSQRRWNRNNVVVSAVGFPRTGIPL